MLLAQTAEDCDLKYNMCMLCCSVRKETAVRSTKKQTICLHAMYPKIRPCVTRRIGLDSAICNAIDTLEQYRYKLDHSSRLTKLGTLYEIVDTDRCINYYVCAIDAAISIQSNKDKARCLAETVNAFAAFQHSVPFVHFRCNRCHAVLQHDDECKTPNACFNLTKTKQILKCTRCRTTRFH
jgi:hypothetical protein